MLGAKLIASSDVSRVIPRRNWTTGTTYDMYEHNIGSGNAAASGATNLFDSTYVVMNSSYAVYKVIENDGATASTVEPTSTSNSIFATSDGYRWKYMYSLTSAETLNFMSTDFIHCSTDSTVSAAAVDGALDTALVVAGGSSYDTDSGATISAIPIRGDGSSGVASVVIASGAVASVSITTAGTGYTFGTVSNAQLISAGATSLSGAELDVIISPPGGHGSNVKNELGDFVIMMQSNLEVTEAANSGDFVATNDCREIVLIRDPKSGGSAATGATLRATYAVKINNPSGTFLPDEEITQTTTGAGGKVIAWDAVNAILYYVQTRHQDAGIDSNGNQVAFSWANVITGALSGVTGTADIPQNAALNNVECTNGYSVPELSLIIIWRCRRSTLCRLLSTQSY